MNNFKMKNKLSIAFGILIVLIMLLGGIAYTNFTEIENEATFTKEAIAPQIGLAMNLGGEVRNFGKAIKEFSLTGDEVFWNEVTKSEAVIQQYYEEAKQLTTLGFDLPDMGLFIKDFLPAFEEDLALARRVFDTRANMAVVSGNMAIEGAKPVDILQPLILQVGQNIDTYTAIGDLTTTQRYTNYSRELNKALVTLYKLRRDVTYSMYLADATAFDPLYATFTELQQTFDSIKRMINESQYVEAINNIQVSLVSYESATKAMQNSYAELASADKELTRSYQETFALVLKLSDSAQNRNLSIADQMVDKTVSSISITLIILAVSLVIAIGLTFYLTRLITAPLRNFVATAEALSKGDFTLRVKVSSKDEIGMAATNVNKAFDVVIDKMIWFENILDAIPDIISITDVERNWTFMNKKGEEMIGKSRDSIIGHQCSEWQTPICKTENCAINCLERGKEITEFDHKGAVLSVKTTQLHNAHKDLIGYIELITDITALRDAQRKAEAALSEGLQTAAYQLEDVVNIVSSASEELSAQITLSGTNAQEAAARLGETATGMEEMNSTVLEVARNASNASEVSNETKKKAEAGAQIVHQVVNSMNKMQQASLELKSDMATLSEHAQAITRIMSVITDIADQTNLLALNAAIEAARAGEAGRGFAVVADEVRKLAEKTMASTADVSNAIQQIQHAAIKNSQQVEQTVHIIEESTNYANQSGVALQEIVSMVESTADQVRAIATAAEEQSSTSEEINRSIAGVNSNAKGSADAMAEAMQATMDLAKQTLSLRNLVQELKSGK